jgi:uncharacterized protein with HEPN domain
MPPNAKSLFYDTHHAPMGITVFVDGKTLDDLTHDLLLCSAVERQFEIMGEAMTRLRKLEPATASRSSEFQGIVNFRNLTIHSYDAIDATITWRIIMDKLPILLRELEEVLKEP